MLKNTNALQNAQMNVLTTEQLLFEINVNGSQEISSILGLVSRYVNASGYFLLTLKDGGSEVLSSDWPYDLARSFQNNIVNDDACKTALLDRAQSFEPFFRTYNSGSQLSNVQTFDISIIPIVHFEQVYPLCFLFPVGHEREIDRLTEAALLVSYHLADIEIHLEQTNQDAELTDRETECLMWMSKGKTSDEIAMILEISRNTVNNYVTSVMQKTAAKSRTEAVARAVRREMI